MACESHNKNSLLKISNISEYKNFDYFNHEQALETLFFSFTNFESVLNSWECAFKIWSIGSTLWAIYFIRVSWKWVKLKRRKNFDHFSNIEKNIIFYKVSLFYFNYNVCSSFFSLATNRFFFAIKKNFFWKSICHN